ncbi:MAG: hypothetical protein K8U57_05380 [Planctomycetes bacterium]|nr:hypothetical protein [Planctomycetota bacterium]
MSLRTHAVRTALLPLALLVMASAANGAEVIRNATAGTPKIKSIDAIRFAPDGVLLIGDGPGAQLIAVDTGDVKAKPWKADAKTAKIDEKLAARIGVPAKGIEIRSMAVNPASQTAYFLIRKLDDKKTLLLTLDGSGEVGEFALENVKHVVIPLPKGEAAPVSRITDIAWMGDRVLIGAVASEEFASKVCSIPAPLDPKATALGFSTETYHVSHRKWETRAPMTSLVPFEANGKKYVVGAFACTPVVRYPLDDVQAGAKVKGESVIELGSGNQPRSMIAYEKDGKSFVLMNTFRFHHKNKPFGWSPYVTFRMESGLFGEGEKLNEKAISRLAGDKPATDKISIVAEYEGTIHLDKLDKDRALVVKEEKEGGLTLAALPLP